MKLQHMNSFSVWHGQLTVLSSLSLVLCPDLDLCLPYSIITTARPQLADLWGQQTMPLYLFFLPNTTSSYKTNRTTWWELAQNSCMTHMWSEAFFVCLSTDRPCNTVFWGERRGQHMNRCWLREATCFKHHFYVSCGNSGWQGEVKRNNNIQPVALAFGKQRP